MCLSHDSLAATIHCVRWTLKLCCALSAPDVHALVVVGPAPDMPALVAAGIGQEAVLHASIITGHPSIA